jgi:hypothetical protein
MAIKILTTAKDIPDGKDNPEIHTHTKRKRIIEMNIESFGNRCFYEEGMPKERLPLPHRNSSMKERR